MCLPLEHMTNVEWRSWHVTHGRAITAHMSAPRRQAPGAGLPPCYHSVLLPAPSQMMPASPLRRHENAHSSVISRQHLMPARWQMHLLFIKLLSDRRITAMQRHIVCPRLCTRSNCECEAREQQFGGRYEDVDLGFFYILMGASSPSFQ